jgi:predicted ATPase/class 3 adenylate cyclase
MSHPLTFLFTDLEDSTQLWEQHGDEMNPVLSQHDAILTQIITEHNGKIVKSTGDGFHAVFESANDGAIAAFEGQRKLNALKWSENGMKIKVRMGLHTGESEERAGDFYGTTVNRAARVMDIAHGGQILLSELTASMTKNSLPDQVFLVDQGQHRLKGLAALEHVYQLSSPDLENDFPPLKSLASFKHNLPRQLTSFVGREKELAEVQRLLSDTRLLTLLGPGGTGKTRLMLQAAEEVIQNYPDGVWLVELATLTNPNKIPDRVAAAINVQEQPGRSIKVTLHDYLRQKDMLLLLDNVEHLVRESAEFVEGLFTYCPNLSILVTGREALFIPGETTLQIPSLSLPNTHGTLPLDEIKESEGVQLFLERSRAVRPDFEVTDQNAATIADIVKRLDGIPLALELAAARMRMLTVEQIAERLNDRFRLLTGGHRTALPRQQTLQALIDWSWNLLDEDEHVLLRRLSVFSGGWNIDAAQIITGFEPLDDFAVFDLMEQLINKSVVNVDYPSEGKARYNLLESIRQYARDKLFEVGEGEELRNRHVDYYVNFAQDAEPNLRSSSMVSWVKKIEDELNNLRTAMTWTLDTNPVLALRLSGSLLYWPGQWIQISEAKSWLLPAVERTRDLLEENKNDSLSEDFIKGLVALATTYSFFSDHIPALRYIEEALQLSEKTGHLRHFVYCVSMKTIIFANGAGSYNTPEWIEKIKTALKIASEQNFEFELAQMNFIMAGIHIAQGNFEKAMYHFDSAQEMTKRINNPYRNGEILRFRAMIAYLKGNYQGAENDIRKAIEYFRAINYQRFILISQSDLAHFLRRQGRVDEAVEIYRDTLPRWQEHSNLPALAHQLECFAFIGVIQGKHEFAARLIGKAKTLRASMSAETTIEREIEEMDQAMGKITETLGEAERDRLIHEGGEISIDDAILLALEEVTVSEEETRT